MQLNNTLCDTINLYRNTNKNVLSIDLESFIRNRSIQTGTCSTFWTSNDGEITAVLSGESISISPTDHLGHFERSYA